MISDQPIFDIYEGKNDMKVVGVVASYAIFNMRLT
jgi:hypothetical protein